MPQLVPPGRNLIPVNSDLFNKTHGIKNLDDALSVDPDKMSITNIDTGDGFVAQFNPTELREKLAANYNALQIMGLSHKPLQYQGTDNHTFDFEMAFRSFAKGSNAVVEVARIRRQILSYFYSKRGAATVIGGAPSRCLFVWPELVSLQARFRSMEATHTMFLKTLGPKHSTYKLTLEAVTDVRIYAEDVLSAGTQRSTPGAP